MDTIPENLTVERLRADVASYREALKTINAYATTPHWTTDRKYKIADVAQKVLRHGARPSGD